MLKDTVIIGFVTVYVISNVWTILLVKKYANNQTCRITAFREVTLSQDK